MFTVYIPQYHKNANKGSTILIIVSYVLVLYIHKLVNTFTCTCALVLAKSC